MLPDFPKLKERLRQVTLFEYRQQVEADDLIGAIPASRYFEGSGIAAADVEGHVDESPFEVLKFQYDIDRSAIIDRGIDVFRECLSKMAAQQVSLMKKTLLGKAGEAADRVGNRIDAKGQPMSPELILEVLETLAIDFDSHGRPDLRTSTIDSGCCWNRRRRL